MKTSQGIEQPEAGEGGGRLQARKESGIGDRNQEEGSGERELKVKGKASGVYN